MLIIFFFVYRHVYVKYSEGSGVRPADINKFIIVHDNVPYRGRFEAAMSGIDVVLYCTEEGNFITNISRAVLDRWRRAKEQRGNGREEQRAEQAQMLAEGNIRDLMLSGRISYMSARAAVFAQALLAEPYDHHTTRGVWIYGPPGCGKSHMARYDTERWPGRRYYKAQNKWFDGYSGEEVIVLDDYDCGAILSHHMKLWTDKFACQAEVKGGTVHLRHKFFIVTSNFTIEEMFMSTGPDTLQAIKRRFEVIHLTVPYVPPVLATQE